MRGVQCSLARRKTNPHNYAILNRRGFSSVRSVRTKKVAKRRPVSAASLPSSPVPSLDEEIRFKLLDIAKTSHGHDNLSGSPDIPSSLSEQVVGRKQKNASIILNSQQLFHLDNKMELADLEGLPLEEKKKLVLQRISEMEAEINKEASEVDDELLQLLAKQDELKKKLAGKGESSRKSVKGKGVKKSSKEVKSDMLAEKVVNSGLTVPLDHLQATMSNIANDRIPSISEIKDLLNIADKRSKVKRPRKSHKKRKYGKSRHETSDSDSEFTTSDDESSSESSSSEDEEPRRRKRGKNKQSGLYAKAGNVQIVQGEVFTHAALDDELGERDINMLPFNLLVAGELEIISDKKISKEERDTRLQVLKKLAYKAEHLPNDEILNQYVSFIRKVEKGKYKWGLKSHLRAFDQQLVYVVSVRVQKIETRSRSKLQSFNDRKKYCQDFNKGVCKFTSGHEGKLNGLTVFKLHVCKLCLAKADMEADHPAKECPVYK